MVRTIFDLIEDEQPKALKSPKQRTIFDLVDQEEVVKTAPQVKNKEFMNQGIEKLKEYGKTALKSTAKGLGNLGLTMGPLIGSNAEESSEGLEEILPTESEDYIQKGLGRGLEMAPTAMVFPGAGPAQAGTRSLVAGFAGQAAEELGLGEIPQMAVELTAFIGPDLTKKLLEKGSNKELIAFAKKMGMTDEAIAPLLQGENKQKWLSKLSPKRGRTQRVLNNTKAQIDNSYNQVLKSENALKEISEIENGKLINGIYEKLETMPRATRDLIEKDLNDLLSNKITGQTLMNFWKDINANMSGKSKELSLLKEPVKQALGTISPELAKDFEMVNSLYTKYFPIASKLKPTLTSDLISAAESLGLLGSFTMGYYPPMIKLLGEKGAKYLARELLINPRLQQLGTKMVDAMNKNQFNVVKKLVDSFSGQLREKFPEVSDELDKITETQIFDLLTATPQEED